MRSRFFCAFFFLLRLVLSETMSANTRLGIQQKRYLKPPLWYINSLAPLHAIVFVPFLRLTCTWVVSMLLLFTSFSLLLPHGDIAVSFRAPSTESLAQGHLGQLMRFLFTDTSISTALFTDLVLRWTSVTIFNSNVFSCTEKPAAGVARCVEVL